MNHVLASILTLSLFGAVGACLKWPTVAALVGQVMLGLLILVVVYGLSYMAVDMVRDFLEP